MKRALLAFLLLAALPALGQSFIVSRDYNLDSTAYIYPSLTAQANIDRRVTTSGASSTTVASVNTDGPFSAMVPGDVVWLSVVDGTTTLRTGLALRWITAKASANSVTIDSAVVIPTAGLGFSWQQAAASTAASAGWFGVQGKATTIQIQVDQMSVTGGIDYALECGVAPFGVGPVTTDVVATANIASASVVTLAVGEPYDVCRVGLKIGTNDNLDVITNGANDSIDFSEGALVCAADIAAASYTGAGLAAAAQAAMNAVGICAGPANPGNAYTVTFNEFAGTYTITSDAASTATFSLLWATGVNNATAADTIMGFAADLAGATTYTGAAVTHDIGAEAEKVTIGVVRR